MNLHELEFRFGLSGRLLIFLILSPLDEICQAGSLQKLIQSLFALLIFDLLLKINNLQVFEKRTQVT